ncbi:MMPL family transporter [Streptacidiphilus anmyonensis]|uniref:MMPL family transporter n=1 Tax=Streptacidiphilus anmyonensis TaxID=405782 RepID=UPI000694E86E|nr:MMPL family transporter [Streptacidiphilus anmyonensis]
MNSEAADQNQAGAATLADHTPEPAGPPRAEPASRPTLPLRRPKTVLYAALLFLILGGILSGGALKALKSGGFDDPASDSVAAAKVLSQKFPTAQPNLVVVVRDPGGHADGPAAAKAGADLLARLSRDPDVRIDASYFRTPVPALLSKDGSAALTEVTVAGDEDRAGRTVADLHTALAGEHDGVQVQFGGITQIDNDLNDTTAQDLATAEAIALPITLVLLILLFRGVVAALLPMAVGVTAIAGALAALRLLAAVTSVSVFATNIVTALGLGLAIDYSLLIVARYRTERTRGDGDLAALQRTMRTAGRTVVFSATIVAAVLCTLTVFPLYFLSSFAYAGLATVAITVLGAIGPLPAMLLLLGDRIDTWPVLRARGTPRAPEGRFWGRVAAITMRRPAVWGLLTLVVLAVPALPLAHAQFGIPDQRALPAAVESHQVADFLDAAFPGGRAAGDTLSVVAPDWSGDPDSRQLADYARALSAVPGVERADSPAGAFVAGRPVAATVPPSSLVDGASARIDLTNEVVPYSAQGRQLAERIRAVPVPGGRTVHLAGLAAQLADTIHALTDGLPWALGLTVLLTLALLALATGSLLLPLKAVLFNALGLTSVLGAMVWVFVDGHLAHLLGFTPSPLAVAMPILLVCVAYALSMDYEMFLLARIKERHDCGEENVLAVRAGLGESGPLISAAAAVLAVSFFSIAVSQVSLAKFFGLGTGIAILLDALVIRGVLVPVFFRLAGSRAWWAPGPLRRVSRRFASASGH